MNSDLHHVAIWTDLTADNPPIATKWMTHPPRVGDTVGIDGTCYRVTTVYMEIFGGPDPMRMRFPQYTPPPDGRDTQTLHVLAERVQNPFALPGPWTRGPHMCSGNESCPTCRGQYMEPAGEDVPVRCPLCEKWMSRGYLATHTAERHGGTS